MMAAITENYQYVGFWERFAATMLDVLLILLLTLPLSFWIYGDRLFYDNSLVHGPADVIINYLLPPVLVLVFWRYRAATPGKILIKAKIVDANSGGKPSMRQWLIRYFAYIPATLPLGLGLLWVAFDARKQGWHDKLAGTLVIKQDKS
ncbi:RDD family protein [Shewanella dokdonensis]|uniref:RDD family protein n=1 Tax=Shewanella dokdonensis TaxID=712036 RepID=A0ABX8DE71_9GAMM|nr:RDD family protein [Shewanella dokdonensis]MCL1073272.1 RDD family protein [Shewanella dokdonensis]QVK22888.1 RDD family protein [Shewanella dokdonensis]